MNEVECTSHWKKVGTKSWRGFVYLNANADTNTSEEKLNEQKPEYSWYNPYYWLDGYI